MSALAAQLFGRLVALRERGYATGRLGVARLPAPVISIGNLSVGGTGKTPTVIALGREFAGRGIRFDVLTRGYRRHNRELAVAESGEEPVRLVGDEPRLIARQLQAPVLVDGDRFRAGLEGERRFGSRLHLLDDGFQHRQLARAFDLVLVAPGDLHDRLLPAGRLREPAAALARASAVLWVEGWSDAAQALAGARAALAAYTDAPVFLGRKRAVSAVQAGVRYYAFCGLARPESFWRTLEEVGVEVAGRRAFRDHHRYRASEYRELRREAETASATALITTAKDAMNLPAGCSPEAILEIEMEIPELRALTELAWGACGK